LAAIYRCVDRAIYTADAELTVIGELCYLFNDYVMPLSFSLHPDSNLSDDRETTRQNEMNEMKVQ